MSITLPTPEDATALSIAFAMFTIETGISLIAPEMYVVYNKPDAVSSATKNLQRVHDFANKAVMSGCKVASLAEVCMCSL